VPPLRDLLDRFRRGLAPPGPALTRVAPPVDRRVLVEAELADLLASIDATSASLDERVADAEQRAAEAVTDARARADDLLRRTDRGLADLRSAAAAGRRHELDEERSRIEATAAEACARIEARAAEAIPGLVDRVLAEVTEGGV
jgi:vacuolar-type H+-ATPase subunit H